MNKVILLGRLTKDPETSFAAGSGTAISRFTVAVNRPYKKDETDFIRCVAFGKTAETISQYLSKGRQIALTGSIRTGSYEAQDGTKRYTTDVAVESFEFVSGGNASGSNSSNSADTSTKSNDSVLDEGSIADGDMDITPVDDGEMPF